MWLNSIEKQKYQYWYSLTQLPLYQGPILQKVLLICIFLHFSYLGITWLCDLSTLCYGFVHHCLLRVGFSKWIVKCSYYQLGTFLTVIFRTSVVSNIFCMLIHWRWKLHWESITADYEPVLLEAIKSLFLYLYHKFKIVGYC